MMRKRFIRALLTGRGVLLSSALVLLVCAIVYLTIEIRSGAIISGDGLLAGQTVAYWTGLAVLAFAATEAVRLLWTTAERIVTGIESAWRRVRLFRAWSHSKLRSLRPASDVSDHEDIAQTVQPAEDEACISPEPVESPDDPLAVWARGAIATGGSVTATALIEESGGTPSKETFKRELLKTSKRLARRRVGIVPDPRFAYLQETPDRIVKLIELPEALERVDAPTESYGHAVFTLSLLAALMHADGHVADEEKELLTEVAGAFEDLDCNERLMIEAWAAHLAGHPVAYSRLTRRLKAVDPGMRPQLYDHAVRMVQADHRIHPAEVEMLEKICKSLELPQTDLYRSLGAWRPADASLLEPEADVPAASGTTDTTAEGIAGEGGLQESAQIIVLDQRRVSSIESDTAEVAVLLSDVFVEDQDVPPMADDPAEAEEGLELDQAHMSLLARIAEHGEISRESFEQLARDYQLMPDGALETLNDWSLEKFEDEIVENGETVVINAALLEFVELDGVNGGSETDQAARA